MNKMKVEIWSDVMCPFCMIGKKTYETALAQFAHNKQIETEWMSYQLDPHIPENMPNKENTYEYLAKRKGMSVEDAKNANKRITEMGKENGLVFNFDKTIVANTFKAHRVIQFAKSKGLGNVAEDLFFKAFFTDGDDLSDFNTLVGIGKEIGLTENEVKQALEDETYAYQVKQDIQEAHNLGLTGVPFFVFNRQYGISGAEPLWVFAKTLQQAYEAWENDNKATLLEIKAGKTCATDGSCDTPL